MKATHILSLTILASLTGAAQADLGNYPGDFESSNIDRAKVVAELREAQASGQFPLMSDNYPAQWPSVSTKTREQVVAELNEAQRLGVLALHSDGDYPFVTTQEQEHLITRAGQTMASVVVK